MEEGEIEKVARLCMDSLSSSLPPSLPPLTVSPPGFSTRIMEEGEIEKVARLCMEAFDAQNKLTK